MNKSASQTKQSAAKPLSPTQGILQRKCACGNHTIAGGECEECSKKKKDGLQRKAINQSEPTNIPPIVHEILNSPGQPLDAETRTFMEPRFGHDFSNVQVHTGSLPSARSALTVNQPGDVYEQNADSIARKVVSGFLPTKSTPCKAYDFSAVRVHTGPTASRAAEAVQAHAFTLGHDIVFGAGEYAPNTSAGRELLAHELTHVVQQAPHLARKEKSAQQGACLFPGGYSEGKGHWGEFNGEPTYFIWGTWRSRDTHKQFLRRIFNIWISSTFGDISPNARARILSLLERIEIYIQEPMPGCQYPTGVSVQDLANIAQLARADMQRRLAAGREARGREEEAGLPPMPRTTEPPVLAQVQPGAARAETLTEQKAGQKAAPIPSTGSEFRGGTSGVRANTPALPATLTGADFGPAGGTGVYTMHLDYRIAGSSLLSQVVEAMNWVNYHWELFDITALARKGLKEQAAKQHRHKPTSKETEVGKMAAAGAEFRRVGERLAEEERTSHERLVQPPSEGETSGEVAERIVANYVNLELMPASTIVGYGGAALGALADLMGGEFQERGIPWPKTEGVYLVRCVAQPDPQGKEGEIRRAPSVAIKIVEVKFVQKLAKEALELPEAQIAEKELELEAEKRRDPPDLSRISRLEKELQDLKTGISGTSLDAIEVAIRKKQEQKREATGRRKEQLEEEIKKLEAQSEFAKKRAGEFTGTIYRPRATLVSEVTGDTYPLLLQVGEIAHEGSTYTYRISDVSTESGKWYEGKGTNPKMAVENAANKMARDNEYGRGSLAFRMPEEWQRLYGKLDLSLRSAPRDLALARQRLNDLVTVLVALSLFVPGVGEVAMVLGAAVAAERLIERARMGTLRLDAAAVGDVLGVLGAAASGAAIVGKIRVVRAYGRFILATTEADEAALVKAASSLSSAKTAVRIAEIGNEIVNWGGFGFGAIVTLDELLKINEEEAKGSISHAEARRRRAEKITSALRDGTLQFKGLQAGRKGVGTVEEGKAGAPPTGEPPCRMEPPAHPEKPPVVEPPKRVEPPKVVEQPRPPSESRIKPTESEARPPAPAAKPAAPATKGPLTGKERVIGHAVTPDGLHHITILSDGRIIRCSPGCEFLRPHYQEFLERPTTDVERQKRVKELSDKLTELENRKPSDKREENDATAKEIGDLEVKLRQLAAEDIAPEIGVPHAQIQRVMDVMTPSEVRDLHATLGKELFQYLTGHPDLNVVRQFSLAMRWSATDAVTQKKVVDTLKLARQGQLQPKKLVRNLSSLMKTSKPMTAEQRKALDALKQQKSVVAELYEEKESLLKERESLVLEQRKTRTEERRERLQEINERLGELDPGFKKKTFKMKVWTKKPDGEVVEHFVDVPIEHPPGEIGKAETLLARTEKAAEQAQLTLYDRLRAAVPSDAAKERALKGVTTDQVGPLKTKPGKLQVDHIVSVREISDMDGFAELSWENQKAIVDMKENLIAMDGSANESKSNRPWNKWKQASNFYEKLTIDAMIKREADIRATIQAEIQRLKLKASAGKP